jgi:hypothetical protein
MASSANALPPQCNAKVQATTKAVLKGHAWLLLTVKVQIQQNVRQGSESTEQAENDNGLLTSLARPSRAPAEDKKKKKKRCLSRQCWQSHACSAGMPRADLCLPDFLLHCRTRSSAALGAVAHLHKQAAGMQGVVLAKRAGKTTATVWSASTALSGRAATAAPSAGLWDYSADDDLIILFSVRWHVDWAACRHGNALPLFCIMLALAQLTALRRQSLPP